MIGDPETARDAAQEAWFEILKALPSYEGRSRFSPWIYSVAKRAIMRHAAKEKRYSTRFLAELFKIKADDGVPEVERIPYEDRTAYIRLRCDECLTGILHCLSNEDRLIYLLRVVGRVEHAEIGRIMELEEASVRQRYSRARSKLSRFLSGNCAIYNPEGTCVCKYSEAMRRYDRGQEWREVRAMAQRMLFLYAANKYHPEKDYIAEIAGS